MFSESWTNWILNFDMIWLISQLLVQPSTSLIQFYHVIFNSGMDLCLVVQARNLGKFLREYVRNLQLSYENNTWDSIIHALTIVGPNGLQHCILLGASYLQKNVYALNDHCPYRPIFNATKIFSPRNYPSDDSDGNANTELELKRVLLKFQYTKEESDMCKGAHMQFMETLQHECENKTILEAWCICGRNLEWHINWPKLMQLW